MDRRDFFQMIAGGVVQATMAGSASLAAAKRTPSSRFRIRPFEWEEATIADLQAAMASGKETAVSLAQKYLQRIEDLDQGGPMVRAVLEANPDALAVARALDSERRAKGPRGPLHGIPILLKDNIDTHDRMMTTAGSLALLGSIAPRDSFVAQRLREVGAVILGKANLSEWANFRGERSSSGWSGRGGQTNNPYVLDRNPSGSSSGSAVGVSANLCSVAIGSETDGSIISPSSVCGIVGIKPTVGLVSRSGIIPISHSQDTAGPMARTVTDAAILLGALTGVDPRDSATAPSRNRAAGDYAQFLDANGLRGARIGVAQELFRSAVGSKLLEAAIGEMRNRGAIIVDRADLPSREQIAEMRDTEREVMLYEFKTGLNAYLASLGPGVRVRTLKDVIDFNESNREKELLYFGQETLLKAQEKGPLTEKAYLDAVQKCRRLSREEGIDAAMNKHQLDAIIAPSGGPAGKTDPLHGDRSLGGSSSLAAIAGYPNITVPAGHVFGLPLGVSFFGRAYSEPTLIKLAFAFEQSTKARKAPLFKETDAILSSG